ncbi:MAG: hypothetical protein QOH93_373 [Chloroflexia bacterium]|nr:hypothetical protein [Chloroflexia bacterium]
MLVTLLTVWLATGSNLFGYRYWSVTQDKYEAALAKWHSLPVEEYEETLDLYSSGKWKLLVQVQSVNGIRVDKITKLESLDETAADLAKIWDAQYFEDSFTVDAMLQSISSILQRPDRFHPVSGVNFLEIKFHPDMGYPQTYTMYDAQGPADLVLVGLKVLK